MRNVQAVFLISVFLTIVGIFIMIVPLARMPIGQDPATLRFYIIATLATLVAALLLISAGYIMTARDLRAMRSVDNDMERLLFDIRDGTKKFFKEKRRSCRIKSVMTAQITSRDFRNFIKTVDISDEGALLKTTFNLTPGELITLDLYLPIYTQPINMKAEVVRVIAAGTEEGLVTYLVGVRYVSVLKDDRRRLNETLDIVSKNAIPA